MSENTEFVVAGTAEASANIVVGTSAEPVGARDMASAEPEAQHLDAQPYDDEERVEAPDWYDDTINVGDEANKDSS